MSQIKYTKDKNIVRVDGKNIAYSQDLNTGKYNEYAEDTPEYKAIYNACLKEAELKNGSFVIEDEKVIELTEEKKKWKKRAIAALCTGGVLAIIGIGGCVVATNSSNKKAEATTTSTSTSIELEENTNDNPEDTKDTPDNSTEAFDEKVDLEKNVETTSVEEVKVEEKLPTYEELYQGSRFTQITDELFEEKYANAKKLAEEYNIDGFNDEQFRLIFGLFNSDHIVQTNPDLANELFGSTDVMDDMTEQGHFMGYIQTKGNVDGVYFPFYEMFIDKVDYEIAKKDYDNFMAIQSNYRIEDTTPEIEEEISNAIHTEFVEKKWKDYAVYELSLGTCKIPQTDSAAVVTENLIPGWYTGNTRISINNKVMDELVILSKVETHLSNEMRTLQGVCQTSVKTR